mmetsp:Transcript_4065/g.9246  ORF Transcript_4065/g.9246 Transcript_4065/m.9246 type:complete len:146 (-) Transcript_4065:486-923(-)
MCAHTFNPRSMVQFELIKLQVALRLGANADKSPTIQHIFLRNPIHCGNHRSNFAPVPRVVLHLELICNLQHIRMAHIMAQIYGLCLRYYKKEKSRRIYDMIVVAKHTKYFAPTAPRSFLQKEKEHNIGQQTRTNLSCVTPRRRNL